MFRGPVILLALLISSPILFQALISDSVSLDTAMIRFLIGVPVAAVLVGLVRAAANSRGPSEPAKRTRPGR